MTAPTSSGQRRAAPIADPDYGTHLRYIVDHRIAALRILRKKRCGSGRGFPGLPFPRLRAFGNNSGRTPSPSTSEQRCNLLQHARCRRSCPIFQSSQSLHPLWSPGLTFKSQQQTAVVALLFPISRCRHLPSTTPQPASEGLPPRGPSLHQPARLEWALSSHVLHRQANLRVRSGYVGFASPSCARGRRPAMSRVHF